MSDIAVGVLGASGDVGTHAARLLHRAGADPICLGSRDLRRARRVLAHDLDGVGCAMAVDAADERSLLKFASRCRVLVNAAGPSCEVGRPVARAARAAGVDLVDAAGDEPLHAFLTGPGGDPPAEKGRIDVLSCGMQPGLTGILPRLLASSLERAVSLVVWFAVVDLFTRAAAEDYLEGTARKLTEPLAAWRNGRRVPRAMRRSSDPVAVPGIDGLFTDLPVLTTEAERLATQLELVDGTWHTLMAQGRVAGVLDRLHALERGEAREALCLASRIDMSARRPAAALLAEVRGPGGARGEPPRIRSGLLRGPGTGALAGAATAAAAQAVLAGEVPPGLHYAAEILDPARTIDRVCAAPGVEVSVVDGPVELVDPVEEGEL